MRISFATEYRLTAKELSAMGAATLQGDDTILISGICTDSREAGEEICFAALRGERVDGHDYIASAIARGATSILCERIPKECFDPRIAFLTVPDTGKALLALASARRKMLAVSVTAVTGSVGKTTTKELIASVLSVRARTYRSGGNHNSLIGMPLSLLEISSEDKEAVLEMGMSGRGEIEVMSRAACPDIAVITNIGTSHMELLGSRENILEAKLEIRAGLSDGGLLLLDGDEPLLEGIFGKTYRTASVSREGKNCDYFAQNIRMDTKYTHFDVNAHGVLHRELSIRALGAHNVTAALFAFAVGEARGLSVEEIREGLLLYTPSGMRQSFSRIGEMTVLEDCYNAAPESMRAALRVLADYAALTKTRSVAVLGDMLELGETSPVLHREVGRALVSLGIDRLCTLGELGAQIAMGAIEAGMPRERLLILPDSKGNPEAGERIARDLLLPGDTVLVKASRGMALETLTDAWNHQNA